MTENDKQLYQLTQGVTRIANYIEEILLLVKKDQEKMEKRMNGMADKPSHTPEEIKELIK